jgi:hypothetical protein
MERYYAVERREKENLEIAFIKVSGNKLEHIAGENLITKMMELKDEEGNLEPKDIAKSKYVILPYENEFQFEVALEQYKHSLEEVTNN